MIRRLLQSAAARRLARALPASWRSGVARRLGRRTDEPEIERLLRQADARVERAARDLDRAWRTVASREDWERLRGARIDALKDSLGLSTRRAEAGELSVVRSRATPGCIVENVRYESRPGFPVSANLYRPAGVEGAPGPGLLIAHSHHCDKSQTELQEMGRSWGRTGCVVLIPDLPGHGERRRHPFHSAADYPLPYPVDRQDYFFRFNLGLQLQLIGDSLMSWMVEDLMRGVDLLRQRPDVDRRRIVLIGAVAGGGDVAAVTAALDSRIGCLVAFGVEGSTVTGETGGETIPGASRPSWESTRCLRRSARDGFLPWLLLAACAPRRLVYAHEFDWHAETDPVWTRLLRVYELYDASDRLAAIHGRGSLSGPPPHNTHCNNVGRIHRRELDPILAEWLDLRLADDESERIAASDLACFAGAGGTASVAVPSQRGRAVDAPEPLDGGALRRRLGELLGVAGPESAVTPEPVTPLRGRRRAEHLILAAADGARIELRLLRPDRRGGEAPAPVVVGVCQHGGNLLLRRRPRLIDALLEAGVAVCLVDVRGTGPETAEWQRGRHGAIQRVAAAEQMLGRTLLGARLQDLRSAMRYLEGRPEIDAERLALWGDSLAGTNAVGFDPAVPYDAGPFPAIGEPLGGLLAIFGALFEPTVRAVYVRRGLAGFASLLEGAFCYQPYDVIVPGLLTIGDIDDLVAALAPLPLRMEGLVDGLDRPLDRAGLDGLLRRARQSYLRSVPGSAAEWFVEPRPDDETARWLANRLRAQASPRTRYHNRPMRS